MTAAHVNDYASNYSLITDASGAYASVFMRPDWYDPYDMRAFFAAHPDFEKMFRNCSIVDSAGNFDTQCWDMSTLM